MGRCGLVAMLVACGTTSLAGELIVNGGFEDGLRGWYPLWTRERGKGKASSETRVVRSGGRAVRIEHSGNLDWSFGQEKALVVEAGQLYRLRAFVRLADLAPLVSQEQTNTEEAQHFQASSPLIREGGKAPVRVGSPRLPGPIRAQPRTGHGAELPDLNRATTTDLKAIDGIGDVLARRILEARARRGGFRTWRDVEAVEGIGASRLRAIQQKFSIRER